MNWIYTAIIAYAIGFGCGWQAQAWRNDAADARQAEQQHQAEQQQEAKADQAAASHEAAREQIRTELQIIYRDRDHVVEKPIYRNVCLDADGLRLIGRAIKPAPASGEPAPAVP